jgi:hypothetical protein
MASAANPRNGDDPMHRKLGEWHGDLMSIRRERAQSRHPNENKGPEEAILVRLSRYVTENKSDTKTAGTHN